ncbi:transcriptional regulator, Spx/MgsR family [Gemella bergeri ATCC 700627]|uniref:Transcriptional regulator, Spx/MgsR family n=1 Tax=Gemella bergeri ATCC 700627 TaxID=1321820 RepID=U2S3L2_9BACL|nr:Spx/MgsR family RNA polymerase-binding regulatory protein [Gemella bergeri]ERK60303.1 transcriptional regulator, Spx/MgsR family [Gemella bergeri ATCC 700627]
MLYIYEYPACSTCKKAKKLLKENNIQAEYFNVKEETPSIENFKKILTMFNIPIKKLFNTSGLVYKELKLKDKLADMTEDEALKLLVDNGMLIKRPLAFDLENDILLLGYKEEQWEQALL